MYKTFAQLQELIKILFILTQKFETIFCLSQFEIK